MKLIWKNFSRNRSVTLAAVAAVAALTLFLLLYANSIHVYQTELANTYAAMEVTGWVEGNRTGRTPTITGAEYAAIMDSGFIKHSSSRITCTGASAEGMRLYGLEDPKTEPNLASELPYVAWQTGYDEAMFWGDELICVAPRSSDVGVGDTLIFPLKKDSPETLVLTVVALYGSVSGAGTQNFYCPLAPLREAYLEAGMDFNYSGLNITFGHLANLETFKAAMLEAGLHTGEARLRIDDTLMQQTTGQLKQQISLLQSMLPVLLLLVAAIGFGLSFLLLRGRKKEAAIMRSLGMGRLPVFGVLLAENLLQALVGGLLGCAITLTIAGPSALDPGQLLLLLACYLLGGAVAVWKISGVNVFNIMTARE